jgi:hypothetical protein
LRKTISLAVLAAVVGALMIAPAANAHRLPANTAQKAANKYGKKVAERTDGAERYSVKRCRRNGDHKFTCGLTVRGESDEAGPFVCRAKIIVRAHRTSFKYTVRVRGAKCQAA